MWQVTLSNRVGNSSGKYNSLIWSLQPIFSSMHLFGISLNSPFQRPRSILVSLIMSILLLVVIYKDQYERINFSNLVDLKSVEELIQFLKQSSNLFSNFGFLLSMIEMVTLVKWKPLLKTLEKFNYADDAFKLRLRKLSISLTIFFIILGLLLRLVDCWFSDFWKVALFPSDLYIYLTVSLFVCVTYAASKSIETITTEVKSPLALSHGPPIHQIIKWKQRYFWISTFVDDIGGFFGTFLFVFCVTIFFRFFLILYSAATFWTAHNKDLFQVATFFARHTIITSLIIYTCEKMKKQNSKLLRELILRRNGNVAQFVRPNKDVKELLYLNELIGDVRSNCLRISPFGMFEISPKLINELVGTTCTYILVLVQIPVPR